MPYLFFRPECGFETCAQKWLEEGGTHHEAVMMGDTRAYWKALAKMLDVEYCEI
jgi:L-arabinose isomerase